MSPADVRGPRPDGPMVDALLRVLAETAAEAQARRVPMGEVLDRLGDAGFSLICLLVALPFLQPFNLGPLAGVAGITLIALGWQLARGHPAPWVPVRLRSMALSGRSWERLLGLCRFIVTFCRRFTQQRYTEWTSGPRGHRACGGLLLTGGLLLALPFPGLPFSNSLPGLMIVSVCIAEMEEDGLFLLVALFFLAASLVYFAFILAALFAGGNAALDWLTTLSFARPASG